MNEVASAPNGRPFGAVLVLGLGRTGQAVSKALSDKASRITVCESLKNPLTAAAADELSALGVRVVFGDPSPKLLDSIDLVVPSPGIPPHNPLIAAALRRGIPVASEIELGWLLAKGAIVAVTGTNGKTTTTTLITAILKASAIPATAAGNIGFPLITAAVQAAAGENLVCEASSFQLHFTRQFHPQVAVVTNVAPDHYDWHSGYADYLAAKAKITSNQRPDDLLIVSALDSGGLEIAGASRAAIAVFAAAAPAEARDRAEQALERPVGTVAGIEADEVVIEDSGGRMSVARLEDIRIQGSHNLENVMAACLAGRGRGAQIEATRQAAMQFDGLPHRSRLIAHIKGVRYIDDSKATNPHAAVAACRGLKNVVLIAGGRAKGLDLTALGEVRPSLKAAVVMGEAAGQIARVFDGVRCYRARDVEEAVDIAGGLAGPGDTVLLSPGCSSLDQYADYAERGDRFAARVGTLEH